MSLRIVSLAVLCVSCSRDPLDGAAPSAAWVTVVRGESAHVTVDVSTTIGNGRSAITVKLARAPQGVSAAPVSFAEPMSLSSSSAEMTITADANAPETVAAAALELFDSGGNYAGEAPIVVTVSGTLGSPDPSFGTRGVAVLGPLAEVFGMGALATGDLAIVGEGLAHDTLVMKVANDGSVTFVSTGIPVTAIEPTAIAQDGRIAFALDQVYVVDTNGNASPVAGAPKACALAWGANALFALSCAGDALARIDGSGVTLTPLVLALGRFVREDTSGNVYVADDSRIERLVPAGGGTYSLDATFGAGGSVGISATPYDVDSSGRVILGETAADGTVFVSRLLPTGALDVTFVKVPPDANYFKLALATANANGDVWVVDTSPLNVELTRFDTGGAIDHTAGVGGRAFTDFFDARAAAFVGARYCVAGQSSSGTAVGCFRTSP